MEYLNICLDNKSKMLYKSNLRFNNEIMRDSNEISNEIAFFLGISRQSVYYNKNKALSKLKKYNF